LRALEVLTLELLRDGGLGETPQRTTNAGPNVKDMKCGMCYLRHEICLICIKCQRYEMCYLFAKVPQPGAKRKNRFGLRVKHLTACLTSYLTGLTSCHCQFNLTRLPPVTVSLTAEAIPLRALPKDTTSELASLISTLTL